jgi:hypothetical protein
MKGTSVIDTVAVDAASRGTDGRLMVPVGGIAHAGARGISRVELQMDDGPWQEARLRRPSPHHLDRLARDLPFSPGEHHLTVRCVDGQRSAQSLERRPPHPTAPAAYMQGRTCRA